MAGVKGRSGRKRARESKEKVTVYLPSKVIDRLEELQMKTGKPLSALAAEVLACSLEAAHAGQIGRHEKVI